MKIEEKTAPALAGVEAGNLADWIGRSPFFLLFPSAIVILSRTAQKRNNDFAQKRKENARKTQGGQARE